MLTGVEPRTPLVEDIEELGETLPQYDVSSICTMDVVEEHRYRSQSLFNVPMAQPVPPRPRSPSIYSMFITDHSPPKRPRCKNPSVYSMPIAAFGGRQYLESSSSEEEDEDEQGYGNFHSDGDEYDLGDDTDSRVFMTRGSKLIANGGPKRHTDVHTHMNFRRKVKNPSVYSMPILGENTRRQAPTKLELQTLSVTPYNPACPVDRDEVTNLETQENKPNGAVQEPNATEEEHQEGGVPGESGRQITVKRVVSRRVKPKVQESITTGLNSCHGVRSRESLPVSYHISVCMGIVGVLLFFIGMAIAIVGFNTGGNDEGSSTGNRVMQVVGFLLLALGFFMCVGCFIYLCVIYLRYKRLASYLKRRETGEQRTRTVGRAVQVVHRTESTRSVIRVKHNHNNHHNHEHHRHDHRVQAAEDIRDILQAHQHQRHAPERGDVAL